MYGDPSRLGWSLNPLTWFGGGSSSTLPVPRPPMLTPAELDADDLAIIAEWTEDVKWAGGAPARIPTGPNAGKLGYRVKGPGTAFPNEKAPFTYYLAPASVLAADARLRTADAKAQADALVPRAKDDPSFEDELTKYGLIAGGVILAAIVLPPLLRQANPRGRRR